MITTTQTSRWQYLNPFSSNSALLTEKLTQMRKVHEIASLEELKQRYAEICQVNSRLSHSEQQEFHSQITVLREAIENYLVIRQRMELLLQDLQAGNVSELQDKYEQLHLCLRQLPRDTQKQHYSHLVQVRDRLERGL